MIRVMVVFGTRPEAIKLAPVVKELSRRPETFQVQVAVTAQHRRMLDQVLRLFDIRPDFDLALMRPGQTLDDIVARAVEGLGKVMDKTSPDMVVVQGDTTTTFVGALTAFHRQIPVAHVEAGLRTWNRYAPFPEEINRQMTSCLATVHFPPTTGSRDNLIRSGVPKERIHVTGNTVIDALLEVVERPYKFRDPVLRDLPEDVILITAHRRESFGRGFIDICRAVKSLAETYPHVAFVYPVHLNPNVREPVHRLLGSTANIHLIEPLDYEPFVHLMKRSRIILTDSGGIQEEAPSLGKPVLVLRDVSERPEGIEAGTVRLVGTDPDAIVGAVRELLESPELYEKMARAENPYGDGTASQKIAELLPGYCK